MTMFLPSGSWYVDEVMTMISSYLNTIIMVSPPPTNGISDLIGGGEEKLLSVHTHQKRPHEDQERWPSIPRGLEKHLEACI